MVLSCIMFCQGFSVIVKSCIISSYDNTFIIKKLAQIKWDVTHRTSICSWNIRGTFPWYIPGIFGKRSLWNSGEYSLRNVVGILNVGIFPECSMNILRMLHLYFWWIKKYISRWGCSWYSLSAFENLIFSWKSNKYLTIANNCLTINYNNNYTILLSSDYVIIESIIMYAFL